MHSCMHQQQSIPAGLPTDPYLVLGHRLYTKDFFYPVVSIFTALLVAPRFRKTLQSASVYECLETRFGLECRLFGAATYVLSQLLKLCTTLFLMAVPISMLLGASLPVVIIFTGVFVTCYSMAGGISAVVYTDVLQVCTKLCGGCNVYTVLCRNVFKVVAKHACFAN